MDDALDFAASVLAQAGSGTTHLKLQKLMFYAYGAARAHGETVPAVTFFKWQHGPVCESVYERCKAFGKHAVDLSALNPAPAALPESALDAVRVYRRLSAWQLRNESHLEEPWLAARMNDSISEESIERHFKRKFNSGSVEIPKNMPGAWSLAVDGLPPLVALSLRDLANDLDLDAFGGQN